MRLGRYEILDELGAGGMATVYRARDTKLRRDVAVKVLFPHLCKRREVVARFQREARAAAALDHPHILRVHDVGGGEDSADPTSLSGVGEAASGDAVEVDPPYIVLELVRGQSLRELLTEGKAFPAEVVACAGEVMCSALTEAHSAGIIHRDIKPANIMVAEGGRLVLADFGVARLEEEDSSLVTRTGALLGTPAFMSPEQAHGDDLDARSDIYSLGATLYQLGTGSMPFSGPTPRMVWAIAHGELQPPLRRNPKMGPDLAQAIERMMAPDPDQRFQNAEKAGAALHEVAASVGCGDADEELAAYFEAPDDYETTHSDAVVGATLRKARQAAGKRALPRAMALADRVLALDPDNQEALELVETLGRGQRRRHWLPAVLVAALVSATALALAIHYGGDEGGAVVAAADAGLDAAPLAALAPDAQALAAASDATPLPPDARAERVGKHIGRPPHVRSKPDAGQAIARTPPDAAPVAVRPPVERPDAAPAPASLSLVMNAWCDVFIDEKPRGRADAKKRIDLRAGTHTVVCSQGKGLAEWSQTVTLKPGEHRTLRGSVLRPVRITVDVSSGNAVRVAGSVHANGASFTARPDRYRIDVLSEGKRVGGGWVAIPRVTQCTIRDKPALDCYR